jgi:ATP-dependent Clp protease ATP-binding subunit ClpC
MVNIRFGLSLLLLNDVSKVQVFGFTASGSSRVADVSSPLYSQGSVLSQASAKKRSLTSLNMVIDRKGTFRVPQLDRLSNECIEAVKEAHDLGNTIGLKKLRPEVIFAGVIARPERARKTLEKYSFNKEEVRAAVIRTLEYKADVDLKGPNPTQEALPFSGASKAIITKACEIADRMESSTVRSEHLLLALLGYNNGIQITTVPIFGVLPDIKSLTQGDSNFSVTRFCDDLINSLPFLSTDGTDVVIRENIVIGGQTGSTNTLADVGVDMTQMAMDGKLDMVFGRDKEIRSALRTLGRRRKNNPCLIGDPGVGKTAVAEAIAQVLANGILEIKEQVDEAKPANKIRKRINTMLGKGKEDKSSAEESYDEVEYELPPCPKALIGARLISVELASLVAGTANRGDFEKKIKALVKEASENNVILFIDEIHNLIGTGGGGDGAMNAANLLKPALARGELRVLGATTTQEYRRYIEKDGALERRFQPMQVKEPTVYETLDILAAISPKYEEYHGVEYTYNALVSAAKLSNRYISDRFLPDKAIDLIDEAGSMIKMAEDGESFYVTEDSIEAVISEISGIPLGKLDTGEKARLKNLEEELEKRIKGQSPAVRAVSKAIRRARSGMRDGKRPVASLMFCGPTGVGKVSDCKCPMVLPSSEIYS